MRLRRPEVHVEPLVLACAAYLLVACNLPFWRAALADRDLAAPGTWGFAAALFVVLCGGYFTGMALLATRWTVRPLLTVLLLIGAAVSFYTTHYSVYFDRNMLANVLATHWTEARELVGGAFILHMVVFGAAPAAALWSLRLRRRPLSKAFLARLVWLLAVVSLTTASLLLIFSDLASLMRNQPEARHLITPGNAVAAAVRRSLSAATASGGPLRVVAEDARLAPAWGQRRRTLFVLVVGETARAQNFSLTGYPRETNPELARRDVVAFGDVTACGTSTEVSLPCMFSHIGRRRYDEAAIRSHESLLHVVRRAGFQVLWRDNQSGCKSVCAGLPAEQLSRAGIPGLCTTDQCLDEILLHGLDRIVEDSSGNLFVVLHQLGSHGPAYHRRYPPHFRRFTPACERDELQRCSIAEIVNAYDNSLLYTDHFLARVIDFLGAIEDRLDTAMLYVSDHGESLGEAGLFLHGIPYGIAPAVQLKVPLVLWTSRSFARSARLDTDCLRTRSGLPLSHDNLFHSILGVLDVATGVYEEPMDIFRPCRSG